MFHIKPRDRHAINVGHLSTAKWKLRTINNNSHPAKIGSSNRAYCTLPTAQRLQSTRSIFIVDYYINIIIWLLSGKAI